MYNQICSRDQQIHDYVQRTGLQPIHEPPTTQECRDTALCCTGLVVHGYNNNNQTDNEKTCTLVTFTITGAVAGQILIPVPVIGGIIGGVGGMAAGIIKILISEIRQKFIELRESRLNRRNN